MTPSQNAAEPRRLRMPGTLVSCVVAAPSLCLTGLVVDGSAGAAGAGVGMAMTVGLLAFGQAVLRLFRDIQPVLLMVIALTSYLLQVVALLAAYAVFVRNPGLDVYVSTTWIGVSALVSSVGCSVLFIVRAKNDRTPIFDLPEVAS